MTHYQIALDVLEQGEELGLAEDSEAWNDIVSEVVENSFDEYGCEEHYSGECEQRSIEWEECFYCEAAKGWLWDEGCELVGIMDYVRKLDRNDLTLAALNASVPKTADAAAWMLTQ